MERYPLDIVRGNRSPHIFPVINRKKLFHKNAVADDDRPIRDWIDQLVAAVQKTGRLKTTVIEFQRDFVHLPTLDAIEDEPVRPCFCNVQ